MHHVVCGLEKTIDTLLQHLLRHIEKATQQPCTLDSVDARHIHAWVEAENRSLGSVR